MADRKSQEAKYKDLAGKASDGRWTDQRLAEELAQLQEDIKSPEEKMENGLAAQNSTEPTPNRFQEPYTSEQRFIPVDDEPAKEFKKSPQDNITQKVKSKVKLFPVKLLKNYRPISEDAQIQGADGVYRPLGEEEAMKVNAGSFVSLPVEEAQSVIKNKIAERNDPIA